MFSRRAWNSVQFEVGGDLPVAILGRQPAVAVVLPGGRQAKITGRQFQHLEGNLQRGDELLLPLEESLVLGGRVFGRAEHEHLDLVEPVHPEDAPGVLAVRAGLAPKARAVARVPQGQLRRREDFVGVVRGERHFGRTDEVEIIFGQVIDVLRRLTEETRTLHGLRLHQRRRDHRDEAVLQGHAHRQVDQGELELGSLPGQVVEAGPGDLRAAFDVDGAEQLSELEMIFGHEALGHEVPRRADGLQHHVVVLAAEGHVVEHQIADLLQHRLEDTADLVLGGFGLLHQVGELLGALQQPGPLRTLGPGDQLAEILLLGPELLVAGDRIAPRLVGRQQIVDQGLRLAPSPLGRSYAVGILAQHLDVDHPHTLTRAILRLRLDCWPVTASRLGFGWDDEPVVRRPPTRSSMLVAVVLLVAVVGWTWLTLTSEALAEFDRRTLAPPLDPQSADRADRCCVRPAHLARPPVSGAGRNRVVGLPTPAPTALGGVDLGDRARLGRRGLWQRSSSGRPRPEHALDLLTSTGFSYPSSHMTAAVASAIAVAATFSVTRQSLRARATVADRCRAAGDRRRRGPLADSAPTTSPTSSAGRSTARWWPAPR